MKRRTFFRLGALGGLGLLASNNKANSQITFQSEDQPPVSPRKAIVLSTWSHGVAANAGAWTVLKTTEKPLTRLKKGLW